MALSHSTLLSLARAGAAERVRELQSEIDSIYRQFPDLTRGRRGTRSSSSGRPGRKARRRRGWTPAQRKAAAERMRKYWAARKSSKK